MLIGIGAFLRAPGLKAADWASVGDGGRPEEVGIDREHGMLGPTCHLLLFIYRPQTQGHCGRLAEGRYWFMTLKPLTDSSSVQCLDWTPSACVVGVHCLLPNALLCNFGVMTLKGSLSMLRAKHCISRCGIRKIQDIRILYFSFKKSLFF